MAEKIKVLIVDDIATTRENISKLFEFHPEVSVIGQASSGKEAVAMTEQLRPDVVLMDINMPDMDGIHATEIIVQDLPSSSIIIMSVQGEQEYLRRAMVAGAKDYLVKPFTGDELVQAIKRVYTNEQKRKNVVHINTQTKEQGKVITVFSTKGGIGKTTIATNLAVTLANKTGTKVCIIDADLQFGDVALFLNLLPQVSIADVVKEDTIDMKAIDGYLTEFNANIKVLAAPFRPEQAETINGENLAAIIAALRTEFQYIVVDTAPVFNDVVLSVLELSDEILMISSMDLPAIKNVKLGMDIMQSLDYPQEKIKVVLNRADSEGGMTTQEVTEGLKHPFSVAIPSDGKIVVSSVNCGVPFVLSNPDAPVAKSIFQLARMVATGEWLQPQATKGVMQRLKLMFGSSA